MGSSLETLYFEIEEGFANAVSMKSIRFPDRGTGLPESTKNRLVAKKKGLTLQLSPCVEIMKHYAETYVEDDFVGAAISEMVKLIKRSSSEQMVKNSYALMTLMAQSPLPILVISGAQCYWDVIMASENKAPFNMSAADVPALCVILARLNREIDFTAIADAPMDMINEIVRDHVNKGLSEKYEYILGASGDKEES